MKVGKREDVDEKKRKHGRERERERKERKTYPPNLLRQLEHDLNLLRSASLLLLLVGGLVVNRDCVASMISTVAEIRKRLARPEREKGKENDVQVIISPQNGLSGLSSSSTATLFSLMRNEK